MASMNRLLIVLILLSFFQSSDVLAAKYVRKAAQGTGTGDNWTNAYTSLPAELTRGETYYIANGDYGGYVFDDLEVGTTWIRIIKATASNSGDVVGWNSSFSGQASFDGITFRRDFYEFNGQFRNEVQWDDGTSYGFRINGGVDAGNGHNNYNTDYIEVRYCNIGGTSATPYNSMPDGISVDAPQSNIRSNFVFTHNYIHHVGVPFFFGGTRDILIDKNYAGPGYSKESVRGFYSVYNVTVSNNMFIDACQGNPDSHDGGGSCTADIWGVYGNSDNWKIFGNLFARRVRGTANVNAVIQLGATTQAVNKWKIYNNTISGYGGQNADIRVLGGGSENVAYNNLWYDNELERNYIGCYGSITCSHNWCDEHTTSLGVKICQSGNLGANSIVSSGASPFINYAGGDFRLSTSSSARNAGKNLTGLADFLDGARDRYDLLRGQENNWDIGAYEYATNTNIPSAPSALRVAQ